MLAEKLKTHDVMNMYDVINIQHCVLSKVKEWRLNSCKKCSNEHCFLNLQMLKKIILRLFEEIFFFLSRKQFLWISRSLTLRFVTILFKSRQEDLMFWRWNECCLRLSTFFKHAWSEWRIQSAESQKKR